MASFDEVQFPPAISANVSGGAEYSTDVVILSNGDEQRNQNWVASRGAWDVSTGVKKKAQSDILIAFFRARNGRARGFRFKDWTDYIATAQTMSPGTALKLAATDVTCTASDHSYNTAGAISFAALLPGDSIFIAGNATSGNNGTKTVVSATSTKLIVSQTVTDEASGSSMTLLRLGPYQLQKAYTDTANTYTRTISKPVAGTVVVYFAGVAHPTWWTIDTTTGIVTLVGGTAAPNNGDALTADFQFDIPARFDTDKAGFTVVDPGDGSGPYVNWQKVPVVEIRLC
jgi:hypothetical protein